MAGPGMTLTQLRLGSALADDAAMVSPLIRIAETGQYFLRLQDTHRIALSEPVGQCQQQNDQRLLVFRIDLEHIVTNTLGLRRFVEQAVAYGFFQGRRDGFIRKPL